MKISDLLNISVNQHASDLHISPGQPPILRVHGDLLPIKNMLPLDAESAKRLIYSTFDAGQLKEFEEKREIDYAISIPAFSRFRVNAFHQSNGVAGVFRAIPEKVLTLDELNMPSVFKQLLDLSQGLILVTGSTGSGKSTTLASMVDYINTHQSRHIITIEYPIEFIHMSKKSLINQRQVKRDTVDFNSALRSALREDPDVILIGEMRDLETIRLALTAAETGHLVMATLHTCSAARTISRIVDAFPLAEKNMIRNMLSESLQAVICQKLVKRIADGRVPAFEILLVTNAIRNLIRDDKVVQIYSSIQTSSKIGMCTLDQYLLELVKKQIISPLHTKICHNFQ
jgi:twitching motility protein PilT